MGTRHVIPNLIEKTKNAINTESIEFLILRMFAVFVTLMMPYHKF